MKLNSLIEEHFLRNEQAWISPEPGRTATLSPLAGLHFNPELKAPE